MYILYHSNCLDGTTAAWCYWRIYGYDATFKPVTYSTMEKVFFSLAESATETDEYGNQFIFLDLNVDRCLQQAIKYKKQNGPASILIVDHHVSNNRNENIPEGVTVVSDLKRSTCNITFHMLNPQEKNIPLLVAYTDDYDMWKNKLPFTFEVSAYLNYCTNKTMEEWDWLNANYLKSLPTEDSRIVREGAYHLERIKKYTRRVTSNINYVKILNEIVPAVKAYKHKSEVCTELKKLFGDAFPFYAAYSPSGRKNGQVHISLRSASPNVDVSAIASKYGGGGHRTASAFIVAETVFYRDMLVA